ncbi:MAG TPA: VOC family protein [Gemmatimonadaceae bacterium]|nr:VOC family protein [Gemmatimonadaceae bacterium]
MIKTYGLTHLAMGVEDPERSLSFYQKILGVIPVYREKDFIQAQTPGSRDVLVFQKTKRRTRSSGSIAHFGFRLVDPADIAAAVSAIEQAGGTVLDHGEFCPGEPYVFFRDLDGYDVEIWHEIPTPVDPT